MLAILIFEATNITINGRPLDEEAQKKLFGMTFERLGQKRKIDVLRAYELITTEQKELFAVVKDNRNKYLHLYSFSHEQIVSDAKEVFNATVRLVVDLIGLTVTAGRLNLKPGIVSYLSKLGGDA